MKNSLIRWVALLSVAGWTGATNASLMLDITDAGAGTTRWVLSGDTVANHSDTINSFWGRNFSPQRPSVENVTPGSVLSGAGSFSTTSGGTHAVSEVWVQISNFTPVGPRASSVFSWDSGDTLSWVGDFITSVPISSLLTGVFTTNTLYNGTIVSPLIVTIGDAPTIPVPTTLALIGLGLAGVGYSRRKQIKAA